MTPPPTAPRQDLDRAVVLSVEPGTRQAGTVECVLELTVMPAHERPYRHRVVVGLTDTQVAALRIGSHIPVRLHPVSGELTLQLPFG